MSQKFIMHFITVVFMLFSKFDEVWGRLINIRACLVWVILKWYCKYHDITVFWLTNIAILEISKQNKKPQKRRIFNTIPKYHFGQTNLPLLLAELHAMCEPPSNFSLLIITPYTNFSLLPIYLIFRERVIHQCSLTFSIYTHRRFA